MVAGYYYTASDSTDTNATDYRDDSTAADYSNMRVLTSTRSSPDLSIPEDDEANKHHKHSMLLSVKPLSLDLIPIQCAIIRRIAPRSWTGRNFRKGV